MMMPLGQKRAFDGIRLFAVEHQVFEIADHEAPVVVQVELDIEAGGDGSFETLEARPEEIVAR